MSIHSIKIGDKIFVLTSKGIKEYYICDVSMLTFNRSIEFRCKDINIKDIGFGSPLEDYVWAFTKEELKGRL
jgi:hypothetical protein